MGGLSRRMQARSSTTSTMSWDIMSEVARSSKMDEGYYSSDDCSDNDGYYSDTLIVSDEVSPSSQ